MLSFNLENFSSKLIDQVITTIYSLSLIKQAEINIYSLNEKLLKKALHFGELLRKLSPNSHLYLKNTETLCFKPDQLLSGTYVLNLETSNNLSEILSACALITLFTPGRTRITFNGVTAGIEGELPIEFFDAVVLPFYKQFVSIRFNILSSKFKSMGEVDLIIDASKEASFHDTFNSIRLRNTPIVELSTLQEVNGISYASINLKPRRVVERQINGVKQPLFGKVSKLKLQKRYDKSDEIGSCVLLIANILTIKSSIFRLGFVNYGEKSIPAEEVGKVCSYALIQSLEEGFPVPIGHFFHYLPQLLLLGGRLKIKGDTVDLTSLLDVYNTFFPDMFGIDLDYVFCR
ncbi:MAG: RNA 3'-terminal phosphate cyclase [bacterium]|nr:RNA 3'-terminal phosphate cyclase [bacterium]